MIPKAVFIYHLDNEVQKLFSLGKYRADYLYETFKLITKVAFLVCEKLIIPASHFFESQLSSKILWELKDLNEICAIDLISSSNNINELLHKKEQQHGSNIRSPGYTYHKYLVPEKQIVLPGTLKKRARSASSDIRNGWLDSINDSAIANEFFKLSDGTISASKFENTLFDVPSKLGEKAYISDYILPLIPFAPENKDKADIYLNSLITRSYIGSFLTEYNATCLNDIPIIDSELILPHDYEGESPYISYMKIVATLHTIKYKNTDAFTFVKRCNTYDLICFKYSSEWQTTFNNIDPVHNNEYRGMIINTEKTTMDNYNDIKIGIITALPKECFAMKVQLGEVKECIFASGGAGNRFYIGTIRSANAKKHRVALTQCGMGNNIAAIRASKMLQYFKNVDLIIMVGIAGGIPTFEKSDQSLQLGDIVWSKSITQYDFKKQMPAKSEVRSNAAKPSARLIDAISSMEVDEFEGVYPWREYINIAAEKYPQHFCRPNQTVVKVFDSSGQERSIPQDRDYPKVFDGVIASANTLLKDPVKREYLRTHFGALAVEMEASGIADATWDNEVAYLVVRGICDYCDQNKNDTWQEYAALAAASYTRALIEKLPCLDCNV